ncbi:hypothetical protein [Aquipuribacter hungaricus]|uniref:Uncharacterized protein n=1 Tax=Aquipuribacter hungaricus TaxID=545624 RepID=A0ABV7WLC7_9MICO
MAEEQRSATARALDEPHSRLTLEMALLLLGAQLAWGLDLPWRVASLVFAVLSLVQGLRALAALRRHRRANPTHQAMGPAGGVLVALGVAVAAAMTLVQVAMLAVWPVVAEQDSCRERALTRTAEARCDDALVDRFQRLGDLAG